MNSIEPPGSADISQSAMRRWGRWGHPLLDGSHGKSWAFINFLASGMVRSRGAFGAQYIPLMIQDE